MHENSVPGRVFGMICAEKNLGSVGHLQKLCKLFHTRPFVYRCVGEEMSVRRQGYGVQKATPITQDKSRAIAI